MLKLNDTLKKGIRLRLPEKWHEKILTFSKANDSPYEYVIEQIIKEKESKETICICRAEKKSIENNKIILTEYVAKYLLAEEVKDSNIGLYFNEYLPTEDSMLLITNVRNPSEVVPGTMSIKVELMYVKKESYISLDFSINFINGDAFTSVKYFCNGNRKSTWKLLLNDDTSYMTDYEKMFCDTIIHKGYIMKSCEKLASYLEKEGAVHHAEMLRQRGREHDDSKISCEDELHALSSIINNKESLKDSSKELSQIEKDALKIHWKHNTHHPEHYNSPIDMTRLDIMEMCCDWHARSTQYGTDFLEFVTKRQNGRFHFPDWMFAEIWHYCEILNS